MGPIRWSLVVAVVLASIGADAQTTPWGDPDLQGVWSNQTPVPLERSAAFGDKAFFTKEEAAEFERTSLPRLLKFMAPALATTGELNEIWLETAKGRVGPGLRTSLVIDPPDGQVPYTPEGRKRWESVPSLEGEREGRPIRSDRAQDRALEERCITSGGLFTPNLFYLNYHRIVQAPGYVVLVTEIMHESRVIPLDRRPPIGSAIRQWLGDSRGRWEGQTLVVETANFNDKRLFRGATKDLRLVERFTRHDADTIRYQLTVTDPATFARPWTLENVLWRAGEDMYEAACHEGNTGLANILSAARAGERTAGAR